MNSQLLFYLVLKVCLQSAYSEETESPQMGAPGQFYSLT